MSKKKRRAPQGRRMGLFGPRHLHFSKRRPTERQVRMAYDWMMGHISLSVALRAVGYGTRKRASNGVRRLYTYLMRGVRCGMIGMELRKKGRP